jgi:uncharacterized protein
MPLQINIRHLEANDLHLQGELPVEELELEDVDELVRARLPLVYDLTAQRVGGAILAQGRLELTLECECSRCLRPYSHRIVLEHWTAHLPLEGPEKAAIKDDLADLTPSVREDILLEFPQHPLCGADCAGLPNRADEKLKKGPGGEEGSSAWAELNKLKF